MMKPLLNYPRLYGWVGLLVPLVILAACDQPEATETSAAEQPPVATQTEAQPLELPVVEPVTINLEAIPPVDQSRHSVPLEEIYFDTFRRVNRVVPLTNISDEMILDLRDAIPPIYNPKFETLAQAESWLSEGEIVLGYADGSEAYAYPVKILNWHEIVSHDVNGRPILATY